MFIIFYYIINLILNKILYAFVISNLFIYYHENLNLLLLTVYASIFVTTVNTKTITKYCTTTTTNKSYCSSHSGTYKWTTENGCANYACVKTASISDSKNGKCGNENGKCPSDKCCSKYGWCGTSSEYCDISKGCQSEFGKCNDDANDNDNKDNIDNKSDDSLPISKDGKCGKNVAKCPSGKCCSKYSWCGTGLDHCDISKGCQSEFGKYNEDNKDSKDNEDNKDNNDNNDNKNNNGDKNGNSLPISTDDKCGKNLAKCPSGKCCSKYGWCGTSSEHCDVSKGCQSEFGKCNDNKKDNKDGNSLPVSTNDKCGMNEGKCPSGKCCSKYGWCGTSSNHCDISKGCQKEFGKCN